MSQITINGSSQDAYGTVIGGWNNTETLLTGCTSSNDQDDDTLEMHSFFYFNTGDILHADSVISQVSLQIYITALTGEITLNALKIYIGDNTIGSTYEASDYEDTINNGTLFKSLSGKAFKTGYHTFTYTTSSPLILAEVSKDGYTNFETDIQWSGGNTIPSHVYIASQNHATEAYRPTLTIEYDTFGIVNAGLRNCELRNSGLLNAKK